MLPRDGVMMIEASAGLEKVKSFLEERTLRHELDGEGIVVPYEIDGLLFTPRIEVHEKWIVVSSIIVDVSDLPSRDPTYLADLYGKMLHAMNELPEINYNVDKTGSIFTSVDMRLEITDYNNFFSEFFAVPYGIKYFIETIAPSMVPPILVKGVPGNE